MANETYKIDASTYSVETDENGNKYLILEKYDGAENHLTIPSSVKFEISDKSYPVKEIDKEAFVSYNYHYMEKYGNGYVTSITIPDSITKIGQWAFLDCENLTSVTIPDSVGDNIGWGAFAYCNNLKSIRLPKSWESKGEDALKEIGLDPSNPNLKITYGDQSQAQDQGQEKAPTVADLAKASAPTAKDIVNALGASKPKAPAETNNKSRK